VYLLGVGVKYGAGLKLYGFPIVTVTKGSEITIGSDVRFRSNSVGNAIGVNHQVIIRTQKAGAVIQIGDHVGMSGGAICAMDKVTIGNNVLIGANVVIADNDFHPINIKERLSNQECISRPIIIRRGAWLGADSYICKGVEIGENSVVAAKSVVTKSIPPNCVAGGIPAKVIRFIGNNIPE